MTALVVIAIANGGEGALTVLAIVRFDARVDPHVDLQVAPLAELALAPATRQGVLHVLAFVAGVI